MSRREKFRRGLLSLYLPYYDALCNELPDAWQPTAGYRSITEQNELYAKGRTAPGQIVTWAKGGTSAHNYGCATDWAFFENGKPVWSDDMRIWAPYLNACDKVGLKKGADFGDKPHNELAIAVSWREVYKTLIEHGEEEAQTFLEGVRKQ